MSVIIKGMDAPNMCAECDMRDGFIMPGIYCCDCAVEGIMGRNITANIENGTRPEWCPAKSIDGLIEKISHLHTCENSEGQDMFQAYDVMMAIKEYCGA